MSDISFSDDTSMNFRIQTKHLVCNELFLELSFLKANLSPFPMEGSYTCSHHRIKLADTSFLRERNQLPKARCCMRSLMLNTISGNDVKYLSGTSLEGASMVLRLGTEAKSD